MAPLRWFMLSVVMSLVVFGSPLKKRYDNYLTHPSVKRFIEYLQIDTSQQENIKYAIDFLLRQARELDLPIAVYSSPGGKPVVVITVQGADPSLPSIMLNSHMDVVPADETEWSHPPYAAVMDDNGDIYARGAQDTKDVGIQYLEVIRRFKQNNVTLLRTLHVTYMPDEETGGYGGIKTFVNTEEFQALNVGFALDEGMTSTEDTLFATYEDRRPWQMQFIVHGASGHGFTMPEGSAAEKVVKLLNSISKYRGTQSRIMKSSKPTDFGSYTSININVLQGGYAANIIPSAMAVVADMRLASDAKISEVEDMVNEWLKEVGNDTELGFIRREDLSGRTQLDDSNPYWVAMKTSVNDLGYQIEPIICPATSDMLVLRNLGIQAVGFSTKTGTISRIHGKDEYLNVETFLRGINIYEQVIKSLGNLPLERSSQDNNKNQHNCF